MLRLFLSNQQGNLRGGCERTKHLLGVSITAWVMMFKETNLPNSNIASLRGLSGLEAIEHWLCCLLYPFGEDCGCFGYMIVSVWKLAQMGAHGQTTQTALTERAEHQAYLKQWIRKKKRQGHVRYWRDWAVLCNVCVLMQSINMHYVIQC